MGEHDGHRERLRRQFLDHGMDVMRDYEVLELLLFYALPRRDTNPIARRLLQHFGTISAVLEATPAELKKVGIGENAAVLLQLITPLAQRYLLDKHENKVVLSDTHTSGQFLIPYFLGERDELAYLVCLDGKNRLLGCRLLQRGSNSSVGLSIRKAAEIAIGCNAASVILAHNHPGGDTLPSVEDYETTDQLRKALLPLDIRLVDHIIVAENRYLSMRESGYLKD